MGDGQVAWTIDPLAPSPALTCRADNGSMVVHTRVMGVSAGWRGHRAQVFFWTVPTVQLPQSQGAANS